MPSTHGIESQLQSEIKNEYRRPGGMTTFEYIIIITRITRYYHDIEY